MPKVSVILTSFNHEKYIREAIDSVLAQTFTDFELIIWDDASSDNSWAIINSYLDSRIKAFRNDETRRGIYGINKAISEVASGEYIAIHHSDDVWEVMKLEKQVEFLDSHLEFGAVFTNALAIGEDSAQLNDPQHFYSNIFDKPNRTRHEWLNYFFYRSNSLCHPSVLIRKQCYEDCGLYRYGLAQLGDFDMWIRLCLKYEIYILPEKLVRFRVRANEANASGNRPEARIRFATEFHNLLKNFLWVQSFEEMVAIFPEAKIYYRIDGFEPKFVLAMVALGDNSFPSTKLFGIELLFDLLGDATKAKAIKSLYDFDYRDLVVLTAKYDVFSLEAVTEAVAERDGQIASLNQAVAQLRESTSWKVTAPVRWVGCRIRRVRKLIDCLAPLWHDPRKVPSTVTRLRYAWDRGGMLAVKQLLLQLPVEVSINDVWFQYRQTFTLDVEADIRERIGRMEGRPLISVLMPVYNTPKWVLRKTIESVLAQLYPDWELCVVDDASSEPQVRRILEEFSARDSRIRVEFGEFNRGIASATNRALEMARGSFVALLDHDDVLEKQALFRLAESILADDPDMIYSDEALMSEDGEEIVNHVYRPAFSPERLRSHPYIVHLVAFRTDLLRGIGGLDASLASSQDYDLILRVSEKARCIVHIPEILYLWRQRESSTGHKVAGEVMETSRQVLARHLERCGERGEVRDGLMFNYYEVRYPLEAGQRVAIIIPTKNHGDLVRQCVESIERTVREVPYDIVVVDHASDDPQSLEYFRQLGAKHQVLGYYEGPFNFSAINNWAVSQLEREYTHYLFCNNDIEATEGGWLERMMELCQKPDVGMVGAKLFYPDGRTLHHAGVCVGMYGIAEHYAKFMDNRLPSGAIHPGYNGTLIANHEVSAVTAACALMRRDVFERIDGFDEAIAVGFGDVDLCLRTREAGYRVLFCPHASLIHHEAYTRGKSHVDPHPEDSALFARKWRKFLAQGDPYYNPNLTAYSTKWEIKLPMEFNLQIARRVIRRQPSATARWWYDRIVRKRMPCPPCLLKTSGSN